MLVSPRIIQAHGGIKTNLEVGEKQCKLMTGYPTYYDQKWNDERGDLLWVINSPISTGKRETKQTG